MHFVQQLFHTSICIGYILKLYQPYLTLVETSAATLMQQARAVARNKKKGGGFEMGEDIYQHGDVYSIIVCF